MAVSAGEFETSVDDTIGCAGGKASRIGGGGPLGGALSKPSTCGVRAPATAGSNDSIALLLKTSRDRFPDPSGPAWTCSCSSVSAALVATARAVASVALDAGEISALRALRFTVVGGTETAAAGSGTWGVAVA